MGTYGRKSEVLILLLQFSQSRKQYPRLKEWDRSIVRLRKKERVQNIVLEISRKNELIYLTVASLRVTLRFVVVNLK